MSAWKGSASRSAPRTSADRAGIWDPVFETGLGKAAGLKGLELLLKGLDNDATTLTTIMERILGKKSPDPPKKHELEGY